jgi:hypothetical protein
MRSTGVALVLVLSLLAADTVFAAQVVLDPISRPLPGPGTFQVVIKPDQGESIGLRGFGLQLNFSGDLHSASANPGDTPFFGNGGFIGDATECQGSVSICAIFTGDQFGTQVPPNFPGGSWSVGELTVESNGGIVEMLLYSATLDIGASGGPSDLVEASNVGAVAGTLPESSTALMAACVIAVLMIRSRETRAARPRASGRSRKEPAINRTNR